MRYLIVAGLVMLGGCGGGTSSTNYSDPPPMAEIVASPSPRATATPSEEIAPATDADNDTAPAVNAATPDNAN